MWHYKTTWAWHIRNVQFKTKMTQGQLKMPAFLLIGSQLLFIKPKLQRTEPKFTFEEFSWGIHNDNFLMLSCWEFKNKLGQTNMNIDVICAFWVLLLRTDFSGHRATECHFLYSSKSMLSDASNSCFFFKRPSKLSFWTRIYYKIFKHFLFKFNTYPHLPPNMLPPVAPPGFYFGGAN